ncbi:MAG: hypothetical protein Q7S85_10490 [Rugosibacter sp.]|nr:hypothetical protein [Rugosibacter sp.]
MAQKYILFFNGNQLRIHSWKTGHVKLEAEFLPDSAGLEAFANWLGNHRGSLFYLLADVTEEGFQREDIPWLQGRDRSAVIKRRLSQYFYGTPLAVALSLGRATEGRRDEKMLFCALTRAEAFAPWLDILHQTEARLAGIWSVPLVLAGCAPRWIGSPEPTLLITLTSGGVRQTFFNAGKMRFSRLTTLATRSQNEIARAIGNEAANTYQYLVGQRQIQRDTAVRVMVLASAVHHPVIRQHCRTHDALTVDFIDLATTARNDGFKMSPDAETADELLSHHLAAKPPRLQFASSPDRRFYHLWQLHFALTTSAWIILASGVLFAAKTGITIQGLRQDIAEAETRTQLSQQRYNALLDSLPKVKATPAGLFALMGRLNELQNRSPDLEPLLAYLSQALNETPKVELTHLEWKIASHLDSPGKPGAGETPSAAPGGAWTTLELQAQLPLGLGADLRAQKEIIDSFVERLKNPQTTVQILAMPFDVESGKPLKSHGEASDSHNNVAPKFSLLIARPL